MAWVGQLFQVGFVATYLIAQVVGSPNHDEVQASITMHTSYQHYTDKRRLSAMEPETASKAGDAETCEVVHSKTMEPIRIGYEIIGVDDNVSPETSAHVENVIMKRAINYWSRTLKVHRVTEPLRVDRKGVDCHQYGLGFREYVFAQSPPSCSSAERPTCGADVEIPEKYLKKLTVCKTKCPQMFETVEHLINKNGGPPCDDCTTLPEGPGAVGVDFMAFITIRQSQFCESRTKAHGSSCVTDQCDRPIFAWINFCPSMISIEEQATNAMVSTAIHEFAHSLAFSSHLYGFFRHPDGTPIFPREADEPHVLKGGIPWKCDRNGYAWDDATANRRFVDLSQVGIIVKASERGIDNCPCPVGIPLMRQGCIQNPTGFREPNCVFKFALPKVREEAQKYFSCPYLVGAELENQPTSLCEIIGSHWESRILMGELMTAGQFQDYIFLSRITLALFEDSGWYQPDYEMADVIVEGVHWGYKQGCGFASEKCLANGHTQYPRFWCTDRNAHTCSLFRREELTCTVVESTVALKPAWDYFHDGVSMGALPEADYCPYYDNVVLNHVCTDPKHSNFYPLPNANFMREVFGPQSRCLYSTLHGDIGKGQFAWKANAQDFQEARPSCLRTVCSPTAAAYDIYVADLEKGGDRKLGTCVQGGQKVTAPWLAGEVTCAPWPELCSQGLMGSKHVMQLYAEGEEPPPPTAARGWMHRGWLVAGALFGTVFLTAGAVTLRFGSRIQTAQRDLKLFEMRQDQSAEVMEELMEQQPLEDALDEVVE